MDTPAPRPTRPRRPTRHALAAGLALVALVALVTLSRCPSAVRVSEETVRTTVLTTLQQEAPEQFLVTGRLTIGTDASATTTTRLLPGVLDVPVGQSTARVRVPGEAAYGFDLRTLRPEHVRFTPEGVVEVRLPPVTVFSAEVRLEDAEVEATAGGWQRLSRDGERAALRSALGQVRPALRRQAEAYVARNAQPRINSAEAVRAMLQTPLEAAGVPEARFRFVLGRGDTLELGPAGRRLALGEG